MSRVIAYSEQYNDCSERYPRSVVRLAAPAAPDTAAASVHDRPRVARVAHRALPVVRQARMQVCRGAGAWAEALPVGEPSGGKAASGLRAEGLSQAGGRIFGQLPLDQGRSRGDVCDQLRTAAAQGAFVGSADGTVGDLDPCGGWRSGVGRSSDGQHDRGAVDRRWFVPIGRGGVR